MIQRKQTIWLLLAALSAYFMTRIPLYKGVLPGDAVKFFSTTESLLLFAVAAIGGLLALVAVFLFKNRKLQLKITTFGLLCSIALIFLEVWQTGLFKDQYLTANMQGTYYWGALLPVAMVIFFFLAISGIRKDEKLIKSLERFR